MTFVARFLSFRIALSIPERDIDIDLRLKVPQHPEETDVESVFRVLAYCHAYEDGLELTRGRFEIDEPAFWKRSLIGEIDTWGETGVPTSDRLRRMSKLRGELRRSIYLLMPDDEQALYRRLYADRLLFPRDVVFRGIAGEAIHNLSEELSTSQRWHLTLTDDTAFLGTERTFHELFFEELSLETSYGHWVEATRREARQRE